MSKHKKISQTSNTQSTEIKLTQEQAASIAAADQIRLRARLDLADFEVQLVELQNKKIELLSRVQSSSGEFMKIVKEVAIANGIDPEGDIKWTLNATDMTFHRAK